MVYYFIIMWLFISCMEFCSNNNKRWSWQQSLCRDKHHRWTWATSPSSTTIPTAGRPQQQQKQHCNVRWSNVARTYLCLHILHGMQVSRHMHMRNKIMYADGVQPPLIIRPHSVGLFSFFFFLRSNCWIDFKITVIFTIF